MPPDAENWTAYRKLVISFMEETRADHQRLEKKVDALQLKVASISAITAFIVAVAFHLLKAGL